MIIIFNDLVFPWCSIINVGFEIGIELKVTVKSVQKLRIAVIVRRAL